MKSPYKKFSPLDTPQSQPIPGENQVQNNAGGFVYAVDKWSQLKRFLILGTEGNTFYVKEQDITLENCTNLMACLAEDGNRVVDMIVDISESGRAHKNDPAIFALAAASAHPQSKEYALSVLPRVCRISTHLFHFNQFVEQFRGRGRALNRAVRRWYTEPEVAHVAHQCAKYQQRDGWSHRDLLRLTKPKPNSEDRNALFAWVAKGTIPQPGAYSSLDIIVGLEQAKTTTDEKKMVEIIEEYKLTHEMIPTHFKNSAAVWNALLPHMPMMAMIRNLGVMSSKDVLTPMSAAAKLVCDRLRSEDRLTASRIHPFSILLAAKTYASGGGYLSSSSWDPNPKICDALSDAFYMSFCNIVPAEKRFMLCVDISSSMRAPANRTSITCLEAAIAMAMITDRTEQDTMVIGMDTKPHLMNISSHQRLDDIMNDLPIWGGGTDLAQPMIYATNNKLNVDIFCIYTDNETWAGKVHPKQALKEYRDKINQEAKMVVLAMTSTGFSVADPADPGSMDIVGLDASVPVLINDFARGDF